MLLGDVFTIKPVAMRRLTWWGSWTWVMIHLESYMQCTKFPRGGSKSQENPNGRWLIAFCLIYGTLGRKSRSNKQARRRTYILYDLHTKNNRKEFSYEVYRYDERLWDFMDFSMLSEMSGVSITANILAQTHLWSSLKSKIVFIVINIIRAVPMMTVY